MSYTQPTGTYNDSATGNMPFGSQVVTIPTTDGVAYIANNINVKKPTKVITGTNEVSVPFRETLVKDVMTVDMELQLADVTTAAPSINAPFTVNDVGSGTTPVPLPFKVSEVSDKFTKDGETFVMVTGRQRFGS